MNDILTRQDVYVAYRKAQANHFSRGYRLPKDWDKHYQKMSTKNKNALTQVTHWFNTKWKEITPEEYFLCGFELLKTFTYHNFAYPPVIRLYIQRDKNKKRQARINKKRMIESAIWVKQYMVDNGIRTFHIYCVTSVGGRSLPVKHYIENWIDPFFLTWLIKDKMVHLEDDERAMMPYIVDKYRDNVLKLEEIQGFTLKLRRML